MTHEIRSGESSKTGRVLSYFLNCEKETIVPTCFMLSLIANPILKSAFLVVVEVMLPENRDKTLIPYKA